MKTIPVTVLYWPGNVGRAYLEAMRSAGLRPARVLLLRQPPQTPILGRVTRIAGAAAGTFTYAMLHRPQSLPAGARRFAPALLRDIPYAAVPARRFRLRDHAAQVDAVTITGLDDPRLLQELQNDANDTVIFTGGGMVPPALLRIPRIRFIHVHPGILPHIRGSDCLWWSLLTRGRPGASCFVLDEGIDQGMPLAIEEVPMPQLPANGPDPDKTIDLMQRLYDPALRAHVLVKTLLEADWAADPPTFPSTSTDDGPGRMYYRMHPRLKHRIATLLLAEGPQETPAS